MTVLKLVIAITVSLVVEVTSTSWGPRGYCKTPEGEGGDCIPLRHCRPMINFLRPYLSKGFTLKTLPEDISKSVQKYECDIGRSRICCPRIPVINITDPINLLPLDSCGKYDTVNRIAHGGKANLYDFPWMAQLSYKEDGDEKNFCGGTLINKNYVLTAAHCIKPNGKSITVRLGEYDISSTKDCDGHPVEEERICITEEPQDIDVEEIERHQSYDAEEFTNDIALLRLKTPVKMTERVQPICLPIEPSIRNVNLSSVVISGFGLTEKGNRSDVLLSARVRIVKPECCKKIIKNIDIGESRICLGDAECDEGGQITRSSRNTKVGQTCPGDSGGPIQQVQTFTKNSRYFKENADRYFQYGVISSGGRKCGGDGAGVHTRLDSYVPWILSHMKE